MSKNTVSSKRVRFFSLTTYATENNTKSRTAERAVRLYFLSFLNRVGSKDTSTKERSRDIHRASVGYTPNYTKCNGAFVWKD